MLRLNHHSFEIIGAGLAGLSAALTIARHGARVRVYEKRRYPCMKLCGEFLSHEGFAKLGWLTRKTAAELQEQLRARSLSRFAWVGRDGQTLNLSLEPKGWGVRRDLLDSWFARECISSGVEIFWETSVPLDGSEAQEVDRKRLYAVGKERGNLKSPYFAVKGYCKEKLAGLDVLNGLDVALYQIQGGYIGFTRMFDGELSYCALFDRRRTSKVWKYVTWRHLCEGALQTNRVLTGWTDKVESLLRTHVSSARFDFSTPGPVCDGRWRLGDSAQLVPPFVGDGMSMAIEGGELAGRMAAKNATDFEYRRAWEKKFRARIRLSKTIHPILWSDRAHAPLVSVLKRNPRVVRWIYSNTRGRPEMDAGSYAKQVVL
ncbi:MAG: NAD(P)-binding protein [Bdellovibrionota bacterium]